MNFTLLFHRVICFLSKNKNNHACSRTRSLRSSLRTPPPGADALLPVGRVVLSQVCEPDSCTAYSYVSINEHSARSTFVSLRVLSWCTGRLDEVTRKAALGRKYAFTSSAAHKFNVSPLNSPERQESTHNRRSSMLMCASDVSPLRLLFRE